VINIAPQEATLVTLYLLSGIASTTNTIETISSADVVTLATWAARPAAMQVSGYLLVGQHVSIALFGLFTLAFGIHLKNNSSPLGISGISTVGWLVNQLTVITDLPLAL